MIEMIVKRLKNELTDLNDKLTKLSKFLAKQSKETTIYCPVSRLRHWCSS